MIKKIVGQIQADMKERDSSAAKEVLAGISSFLSLSYIFIVNPSILSEAGMNPSSVLFATVLASALSTIAMGIYARLPFVLAPGLEMNAYVAFVAVAGLGLTWQQGLGAVFWSGVIFIILTFATIRGVSIRERLIYSIPEKMKFALAFTVGAFVFAIGLRLSGIVIYDGVFATGIGELFNSKAYALYIGIGIILLLEALKVPGSVLISIIITAVYCNIVGLVELNPVPTVVSDATSGIGAFDVFNFSQGLLTAVIILFLVDFYGSLAKFIGMTISTSISQTDEKGRPVVPRTKQALTIDGIGTLFGSWLGTTSITTYVESAIGIAAGGRTGLTAIVAGVLMFTGLLLLPYMQYLPVVATTGSLVFVGYKLIPNIEILKQYSKLDFIVSICMGLLAITTFSLDLAMIVGFSVYIIVQLIKEKSMNWFLCISLIALLIGRVLQASA